MCSGCQIFSVILSANVSYLINRMDHLSIIKQPITSELNDFISLFNSSLSHDDGLLGTALEHVRKRAGKRMRPMLILLIAKNYGQVTDVTQNAAVGLELLHTASLVHDDVVDESGERRGQASVNAAYDNKVAVLVGDYILSTALLRVARTHSEDIVAELAELGRVLSDGEILQLTSIGCKDISEEVYYQVISRKTAALFEACAGIGAMSAGAGKEDVDAARAFGRTLGMIFQIRDDIFDYYDSPEIGKPTGNDMAEGKLTLPIIYALNATGNEEMRQTAYRVKSLNASKEDIEALVAFAKDNGGIDYAEKKMLELREENIAYINKHVMHVDIRDALTAYMDFVIYRKI